MQKLNYFGEGKGVKGKDYLMVEFFFQIDFIGVIQIDFGEFESREDETIRSKVKEC